jgi:hypothetical protein
MRCEIRELTVAGTTVTVVLYVEPPQSGAIRIRRAKSKVSVVAAYHGYGGPEPTTLSAEKEYLTLSPFLPAPHVTTANDDPVVDGEGQIEVVAKLERLPEMMKRPTRWCVVELEATNHVGQAVTLPRAERSF